MQGELGAGKTWLTKGIARGIGIDGKYEITSPTFTLINEYPGETPLFHLDAYRLRGIEDLWELDYEAIRDVKGICVIEWAERIREELPETTLTVAINYQDVNIRELILSGDSIMIDEINTLLMREVFFNGINRPEVRRDLGC